MTVTYEWRGEFGNDELEALHAEGFGHAKAAHDWWAQLSRHSLGWVCARGEAADDAAGAGAPGAGAGAGGSDGTLLGFVNVPWDGAAHAFIMDTVVASAARHQGVGVGLVGEAERRARAAGCEWLHVDFEEELAAFYFEACGFRPTQAGLIRLKG